MAFRKSLESSLLLRLQEIGTRADAATVISRSLALERKYLFPSVDTCATPAFSACRRG